MRESIPFTNEIISFAVMLLMTVALIAGEADATVHGAARLAAASDEAQMMHKTHVPFSTTINARIDGEPLTISIDAVAEFSHVSFGDR